MGELVSIFEADPASRYDGSSVTLVRLDKATLPGVVGRVWEMSDIDPELLDRDQSAMAASLTVAERRRFDWEVLSDEERGQAVTGLTMGFMLDISGEIRKFRERGPTSVDFSYAYFNNEAHLVYEAMKAAEAIVEKLGYLTTRTSGPVRHSLRDIEAGYTPSQYIGLLIRR